MSAHVVAKAKPTPNSDEEEKTTLESQWEEEGSTTVEQGDVADKIRALGVDPPPRTLHELTHTGNHGDNEPTVDDQHAHQVPSLTPPVANVARLVITQGNDTGRELEIRPGKQFTIGRGLDNDFVLTDIAVSRKHFDIIHDQGAWVIVDRGSGNGTIVNGNVEDNPFMLANGDQIEIGNTVFRFEVPNGPQRAAAGYEVDVDDEELSTVAGKPLRSDPIEAATPVEQPLSRLEPPTRERPKTLPPPAPMRSSPASAPPYAMPVPATTMPLPQMANRGPIAGPGQPTMLVNGGQVPGMLPTTLPGQGQMRPAAYPQATEIPPHSVHAQMMLIQAQQGGRLDPSTAHVPPTPYQVMPGGMQLRQYVQPQLTKKTKLLLAAAAVSALAAIITVAILKSGNKPAQAAKAQTGSASTTTVEPIKETKPQVAAIQPSTPATTPPTATTPSTTATTPSTTTTTPSTTTTTPSTSTSTSTSTTAKTTTTATPTPTPTPTKTTTTATTSTTTTTVAKTTTTPPTTTKTTTPPTTTTTAAKSTPPKETRPKRTTSSSTASTTSSAPPKRVATGPDIDAARARADEAYHARRFQDASNIIRAASPPGEEGAKLRHQADLYLLFQKAYSHGTAPGEKPTDQYKNLQEAINYDQSLGRFYEGDLTQKLQQVAPKAATLFLANRDYKNAHTAVIKAESLGVKNNTTQFVRDQLDDKARDLYNQALKESGTNPDSAGQKARTILEIVDPSNPWAGKAKKLLAQLAQ